MTDFSNYQVHIYTDGAAKGNPGLAGYGVVMEMVGTPYKKEFYEGFRLSTNNRMELLAVIVGLEKLKNPSTKVLVVSDSKYVVDAVTKKWVFTWEKINFKNKTENKYRIYSTTFSIRFPYKLSIIQTSVLSKPIINQFSFDKLSNNDTYMKIFCKAVNY